MIDKANVSRLNGIIATVIKKTPNQTYVREFVFSNEDGDSMILTLQARDYRALEIEDREREEGDR